MTALKGTQATFGIQWENIHGSFTGNSGLETKERVTNVAVPNVSATQSYLEGKLAAGLSVQSPFGLETHWDGNSPMRYVATNSVLHLVYVTPAIAYQVHPKFSVGAGVDYINLFDAQLDREVATGGADGTASLRGQAASWSFHTGIVYQPTEQHAIGITYHNKVNLRVNGNVTLSGLSGAASGVFGSSTYSTSAYTDLVLPQNIQFGYAYKPNENWIFEADTAWYHWSEGRELNVRYAETDPTRLGVLTNGGASDPVPLTSRDAWSANAGVNYRVNNKWQVRTGFWYEPWALPESTFNPAFMDLSRYGVSVGAGYAIIESLTVDAAYTVLFFHNRTINNNVQANTSGIPDGFAGTGTNGTYKDFANLLALNFTYRFGNSK